MSSYTISGSGWDDTVGWIFSAYGPSGRAYMVYDAKFHLAVQAYSTGIDVPPSWRVWRGTEWIEPHSNLTDVLV